MIKFKICQNWPKIKSNTGLIFKKQFSCQERGQIISRPGLLHFACTQSKNWVCTGNYLGSRAAAYQFKSCTSWKRLIFWDWEMLRSRTCLNFVPLCRQQWYKERSCHGAFDDRQGLGGLISQWNARPSPLDSRCHPRICSLTAQGPPPSSASAPPIQSFVCAFLLSIWPSSLVLVFFLSASVLTLFRAAVGKLAY